MAESNLVELIKLVGGIAGLLTAAFTVYDRAIKSRPVVNIIAKKDWPGVKGLVWIQVKNPTDRDIIIEEISTSREDTIFIGPNEATSSLLLAVSGIKRMAVIGAGSERMFPMHLADDDPADLAVKIEIVWRPVTARWFNRMPVTLYSSTGSLRELMQEAEWRLEVAEELRRR